jgi:hypothetical protein
MVAGSVAAIYWTDIALSANHLKQPQGALMRRVMCLSMNHFLAMFCAPKTEI